MENQTIPQQNPQAQPVAQPVAQANKRPGWVIPCAVISVILFICCICTVGGFGWLANLGWDSTRKGLESTVCASNLKTSYTNNTTSKFKSINTQTKFETEVGKISADCSKVKSAGFLDYLRNGWVINSTSSTSSDTGFTFTGNLNGKDVVILMLYDGSTYKLDSLSIQ